MKKMLRLLPYTLFLLGLPALAQNTITAEDAWIRLLPRPHLAAYLTFSNPTDQPIRLLSVSTPVAAKAEFHDVKFVPASEHGAHGHGTHGHGDGAHGHGAHGHDAQGQTQIAVMFPLEDVVVPARGKLEFKPGGKHVMLLDVKRTLKEGEKVPLVFRLEGGRTLVVLAVVKKLQ